MRYVDTLRHLYPKPPFFLPQPYRLFRWPIHHQYSGKSIDAEVLFSQALGLKSKACGPRLWRNLTPEKKQFFQFPPELMLRQNERVQRGYETVSASRSDENPYYDLNLYPWEIIKDKLRKRITLGSDVYDWLIQEAILCSLKDVSPGNLSFGEATINGWDIVEYWALPERIRSKYHKQYVQKNEYVLHRDSVYVSRSLVEKTAFNVFFKERVGSLKELSLSQKQKAASSEWKKMLPTEKANYGYKRISPLRRDLREFNLEQQTSLVMDYIFKYGTVENMARDWREWRDEAVGDLIYLDRMYSQKIVMSDKNYNLTFLDKVPESLEDIYKAGSQ